ncbi:lipopolysaccharide biosynthesis protein [Thioalkalivibrio sp. ALJ7]|uniref:lipopolysaccharide biosynthesis protein n=1 Tax=Thioalkalivibrio sp. ALJ7 TaxID=1158756 RepID=UPI00037F7087|nr:lipopolysaccharide biosynthesis protein [Thioalkalivibrio sp. ALJ7]
MKDLGNKVASGAAWMMGLRTFQRFMGLISTVILARILVPEDFGLVAMAFALYALVEMIGAFGLDLALIRDQKAERRHYDTAWTIKLIYQSLGALALILAAPHAAAFFDDGRVEAIVYAFAAISFLHGFENIGIVAFRKELTFRKEFLFGFGKKASAVVVTIAMAFYLQSYWALVLGSLTSAIVGLSLSYGMHPFRPRLSLSGWRDLIGFSAWITFNNAAMYGQGRGPDWIVGRLEGAAGLGAYRVASDIAKLPSSELYAPIMRAVFPGFAKVSHDLPRLRRGYLLAQGMVTLLTVPAALGMVGVAAPLIWLLLGENWLVTIPLVQVLAILGATRILHGNRFSLFMALNKPYWVGIFVLADVLITLPLMGYLLWAGYGLEVAVWSKVIASTLLLPFGVMLVSHFLQMQGKDFFAVVWRPVAASIAMLGVLLATERALPELTSSATGALQLVVLIPLGIATYALVLLALWFLSGRPLGAETRGLEMAVERKIIKRHWAMKLTGNHQLFGPDTASSSR